jgi:hypothetical protein
MRKLGAIVGVLLGFVTHVGQDCSLRSAVALQFVGDHPEWFLALTSHQSTKESLGCMLIAPRLQQNIDDISVLIHRTPKIMLQPIDFHEDFVQIPNITKASLFLPQTPGIVRSEFPAPSPDGFVGNNDAALRQKIFHITEAQTKAMVDPHCIADDFRRKTVSMVTSSGAFHGRSLSQLVSKLKYPALRSLLNKQREKSDLVFHQRDGSGWKLVLESFRSILKRCGLKRVGIHALRHTFGAHLGQRGVDMAIIRDLLGHHSVTLTEKYYAHLAPSSLSKAVRQLEIVSCLNQSVPKIVPTGAKTENLDPKNANGELPLTDSFERCYVPEVTLLAGVAKLAYAADSKSAGVHSPWGFKSLLRHSALQSLLILARTGPNSR